MVCRRNFTTALLLNAKNDLASLFELLLVCEQRVDQGV